VKLDITNFRDLTAELSADLMGSKYLITPDSLRLVTDIVIEKILNDPDTPEEVSDWIKRRLIIHHDREFAEKASILDAGDLLIKAGLKSFAIKHQRRKKNGLSEPGTDME